MVVIVRIEVTDEQRKALRKRMGRAGKASRDEIVRPSSSVSDWTLTTAVDEYRASIPNIFDGAR